MKTYSILILVVSVVPALTVESKDVKSDLAEAQNNPDKLLTSLEDTRLSQAINLGPESEKARTHLLKKILIKKPILIKKKYRDSSEEVSENLSRDDTTKNLNVPSLVNTNNSMSEIERNVLAAKTAIESLQKELQITDSQIRTIDWKSSSSEIVEQILKREHTNNLNKKGEEMATSASEPQKVVSPPPHTDNKEKENESVEIILQPKSAENVATSKEQEKFEMKTAFGQSDGQEKIMNNQNTESVVLEDKLNEKVANTNNNVDMNQSESNIMEKVNEMPAKNTKEAVVTTALKNTKAKSFSSTNDNQRLVDSNTGLTVQQLINPSSSLSIKPPANGMTLQNAQRATEMRKSLDDFDNTRNRMIVMNRNQARYNNRGAYYGPAHAPTGAVGIFPQAKISDCAIPLLMSCSPSIAHGKLTKPYYVHPHPNAYKRMNDEMMVAAGNRIM